MKRILMMAAALSLLTAPAAMAQHRHEGHGQHAGARHNAKARHANRSRPAARRNHSRARPAARNRVRHANRAYNRHANRAGARRAAHQRHYNRGAYRHDRNRHVAGRYHGSNRNHWRHASRVGRWHRGYRLPRSYWGGHRWIDWRAHRLWAPPYGYQWVYVDGDYVLLAIATGLIADIVIGNSYY